MKRVITSWIWLMATLMLCACPSSDAQQLQGDISTSGGTLIFQNSNRAGSAGFEELITGVPSAVSVIIKGCYRGTTCDTLDTYTTVANSVRKPTQTTIYDYFQISATFTGGTNTNIHVNLTMSVSRNYSPGGGGGSVNSVFGRAGDVVASGGDYVASQVTNAFDTTAFNDLLMISTPAGNPAAGSIRFYAKTGNLVCFKNSSGTETCLGTGGGGTPAGSAFSCQFNNSGAFGGTTGCSSPLGTYVLLSDPWINEIRDGNGNLAVVYGSAANAVNYWFQSNSPTGQPVTIVPSGSDANIAVNAGAYNFSGLSAYWQWTSHQRPLINNSYDMGDATHYYRNTYTQGLFLSGITGMVYAQGTSAAARLVTSADIDNLFSGTGKCYLFKGTTPGTNDGCDLPSVGVATSVTGSTNNVEFITGPKSGGGTCGWKVDTNNNWSSSCPITVSVSTQFLATGVNSSNPSAPAAGSTGMFTGTNGFSTIDSTSLVKVMTQIKASRDANKYVTHVTADGLQNTQQPQDVDINFTDNTTGNVSTSAHGYAPKLDNNVNHFLNGQGGFTTPAGGSGAAGYSRTMLADVALTTVDTYYEFLNIPSLAAGSYLLGGTVNLHNTSGSVVIVTCKTWDGTNNFDSKEISIAANGWDHVSFNVGQTFGGTTTYKGACAAHTGSAVVAVKAVTDNAAGSTASNVTATVLSGLTVTAVSVGVSPTSASITSPATQGTTSTVTNDIGSMGTTWSHTGGTPSGCGNFSASSVTTSTYDPAGGTACTTTATVNVTATSIADPSKNATNAVLVTVSGGGTPPTMVSGQFCNTNSASNCVFASPVTTGNSVMCLFEIQGLGDKATLGDATNGGYTRVVATQIPTFGQAIGAFFKGTLTGGFTDVNQTNSGVPTGGNTSCYELNGGNTFDGFSYGLNAGSSGNITTTGADLLLSTIATNNGSLSTPAGWTLDTMAAPNFYQYYYHETTGHSSSGSFGLTLSSGAGDILAVAVKAP